MSDISDLDFVTFKCVTCSGSGFVDYRHNAEGFVTLEGNGRMVYCPDCNGAGKRVGLARPAHDHDWEEYETVRGQMTWRRCRTCPIDPELVEDRRVRGGPTAGKDE